MPLEGHTEVGFRVGEAQATSGMQNRSLTHARWNRLATYRHPTVRDVAFVLACPQLVESSETLRITEALPNQGKAEEEWEWLQGLDESPQLVENWMEEHGKHRKGDRRLGIYYSDLVEFVLQSCPSFDYGHICTGVQVNGTKRRQDGAAVLTTIGEFDVLLESQNGYESKHALEHWEMTVKFLLHVDSYRESGLPPIPLMCPLNTFLGPHKAENLLDRTARLQRQLRLSKEPAAMRIIEENFEASEMEIKTMAHIQGYLFYHVHFWAQHHRCLETSIAPDATQLLKINPKHWHGWWLHADCVHVLGTLFPGSRWHVVPKLRWLSPVVMVSGDDEELLSLEDLIDMLSQLAVACRKTGKWRQQRLLLAEMTLNPDLHDGVWIESSRGFVVEQGWPTDPLLLGPLE